MGAYITPSDHNGKARIKSEPLEKYEKNLTRFVEFVIEHERLPTAQIKEESATTHWYDNYKKKKCIKQDFEEHPLNKEKKKLDEFPSYQT